MPLFCATKRYSRIQAVVLAVLLWPFLSAPAWAGPAPLKIGATVSLEGKYLETSAMVWNGCRLWPDQVNHTGRQVGHNPILIQWQNRKKEIVYPSKMRTAKPVLGRLNSHRPNG